MKGDRHQHKKIIAFKWLANSYDSIDLLVSPYQEAFFTDRRHQLLLKGLVGLV